jgi:hypothetical protein
MKIVTGKVRFSYVNAWEPQSINGSEPKYSVSLIIFFSRPSRGLSLCNKIKLIYSSRILAFSLYSAYPSV